MTDFDRMDISSSPPTGRREISEPSPTQYKSEAIVVSSDSGSEDEGWRRKPDLATDEQESHYTDQSLTPTNHRNSPPIPRIYAKQALESMNNYTILEHATSSPRTANPPITILLALTPRPASLRDQAAFDSFGARFSADFSNISVAGKWGCVSLYAHFRECMKGGTDSEERRYQEAGYRDDAGGCCASQDSSTNLVPTVRANEDPNTVKFHTTILNEVEVEMSIHDQDQEPSSGGDVSKLTTDLGWAEHPYKSPVKQLAPPQITSVVREMTTTTKPSPTYDRPEVGIGNIHPTALLAKLNQESDVHWRLCLPVLQELIELEVAKGRRLIVVGGLKMGDIAGIRTFARKIAEPAGILAFLPGDSPSVFDSAVVPGEYESRTVMVNTPPHPSQSYTTILAALFEKGVPRVSGKAFVADSTGDNISSNAGGGGDKDESGPKDFDGDDRVMSSS